MVTAMTILANNSIHANAHHRCLCTSRTSGTKHGPILSVRSPHNSRSDPRSSDLVVTLAALLGPPTSLAGHPSPEWDAPRLPPCARPDFPELVTIPPVTLLQPCTEPSWALLDGCGHLSASGPSLPGRLFPSCSHSSLPCFCQAFA